MASNFEIEKIAAPLETEPKKAADVGITPYQFKKGKSGNPKGRKPNSKKTVAELCRAETRDAIKILKNIMNDEDAKDTDRIKASTYLIDRGWGRVVAADNPLPKDVNHHHLHELSTEVLEKLLIQAKTKTQTVKPKRIRDSKPKAPK